MSLTRIGGQLVDDSRSCVVPDCGSHAAAEPYQVELPRKAGELERHADALQRQVHELRAQAEAIRAEVEAAQPHAYLCGGCKARLPAHMRGPWSPAGAWSVGMPMGGRASAEPGSQAEADIVARTLAALNPTHHYEPEPTPAGI